MSEEKRFTLGLSLDDYYFESRQCVSCHNCRWIDFNYVPGLDFSWRCPPWQYEQLDAYGLEGKTRIAHDLMMGKLDWSDPKLRDIVYKDTLCGACNVACERNLDLEMQMLLESLRARMVEKGYGPMPEHQEVTKKIEETANPFGEARAKRLDWMPAEVKPAEKANILYFAGCRTSFIDKEISTATVRILNAANVPFMVMKDEPCCGYPVYETGQMEKARKMAEENLKLFRETGAKTVICSCSCCYKTIKVDYPKLLGFSTSDLGFEVLHPVELFDKWVKEGTLKLSNRVDMKITYHDPCNLGRLSEPWIHWEGVRGEWGLLNPTRDFRRGINGVYEPPRDILKAIAGIELVEMPRRRENAWCCGAGAGVKEAFPDLALWSVAERLREAASTGAEAIVSCCPLCKENFTDAKNGMKIYDITELIARAIGK